MFSIKVGVNGKYREVFMNPNQISHIILMEEGFTKSDNTYLLCMSNGDRFELDYNDYNIVMKNLKFM